KFDTVPSSLSAELRVRMNGFDMEQLNGSASVYDLRYRRGNNNLYVDSIVAITNGTSIYRKTTINSNLFDFTAVGVYEFNNLAASIQNYLHETLPTFVPIGKQVVQSEKVEYSLDVHDINYALKLFYENMEVSPFKLNGSFNSNTGFIIGAEIKKLKVEGFTFQ